MPRRAQSHKVLMVLESCYPTEGGGGAENQLRTLSRYLHQRGVPVAIIAPMTREAPPVEHDTVDGVPVWRIPFPQVRLFGGILMLAKLAFHLLRNRAQYGVIHAHMAHNMAVVSSVIGWLLHKTVIVKITGALEITEGILDSGKQTPGVAIKRRLLRCATHFQATSSEIRDRLVENGIAPGRIHVIPNAVDLARFDAVNRTGKSNGGPMTGIYVGRLSQEKAPDVLISAWMEAVGVDSEARLLLVGDGAMRESLQQTIAETGRAHQIRLIGPQDDINPFLEEADFAVLPSFSEGLSNALLEYMAAGLPVLGTRVSGTVDFIEPGQCGWLVEPGDGQALANALRTIMNMSRASLHEMGELARKRVASRAGINVVIKKLGELYEIDADMLKTMPQKKAV